MREIRFVVIFKAGLIIARFAAQAKWSRTVRATE
jgi:hypothetical protein